MIDLTDEQRKAIEHDGGNLLILACAGSGKTETLAARIARMVGSGVEKSSIVAFTFTEHAATELKHRIRIKLEAGVPHDPAIGDMYIGTIHSFCMRMLKELNPAYRQYEVMDEARQAALIAANFVRFEDNDKGIGLDRLRSRTRSKTYGETLRSFISTLNIVHQKGINHELMGDPTLRDAISRYEEVAYGNPNYFFDFNKIIDELIDYFESNPAELDRKRREIEHIFVDEYQDVDDRQERLIQLLSDNGQGPLVTVVGDDDQALYGFRGASVKNILEFRNRYPDVYQITLQKNFRSTHAIVSIADEAVRKISSRIDKEPKAVVVIDGKYVENMADKGDVQLACFASDEEEAGWVADQIETLRGACVNDHGRDRGVDYGDMAILLRSVRSSGSVFAKVLRERGIPVVISGTRGLFDNDEIRLAQAAFCLLARSEFALPDENSRIQLYSTVETREIVRGLMNSLRKSGRLGESANSTHFLSWIDKYRADLDVRSLSKDERTPGKGARIYPQLIYHEMIRELGSQKDFWPSDVLFNLGAFSKLLTEFESVHQWITPARLKTLTLFLSNWAAGNVDEGSVGELAALNSVRIMTVHAAKGLEWPVVFLPRISSSNFPSSMRSRGPETLLKADFFDPKEYASGDDGERRLWYVALTRCSKYLHISSLDRTRKRPTKYFTDIEHDCISRNGERPHLKKITPEPPSGSDLLPTTYSDLSVFWRCKHEYMLRSLMDFSPGVGEQFGYGQQMHNLLAQIHNRAQLGELIDVAQVKDFVYENFHLRYTRNGPFEAMRDAAVMALEKYVRDYAGAMSAVSAIEKPFEFIDQDSQFMISGTVDLLEEKKGNDEKIVGLVDFKTSKIRGRNEYEEIKAGVADQLQLYALGVHYSLSKDPQYADAHIISHSEWPKDLEMEGLSERIPIDISNSAREKARRKVASAVKAIREGISETSFERTGVKLGSCKKCDFRSFCKGALEHKSGRTSSVETDRVEEVSSIMEDVCAGKKSKQ